MRIEKSLFKKWVILAYPEDEDVLSDLPESLIFDMYPEVLANGPAVNEVKELEKSFAQIFLRESNPTWDLYHSLFKAKEPVSNYTVCNIISNSMNSFPSLEKAFETKARFAARSCQPAQISEFAVENFQVIAGALTLNKLGHLLEETAPLEILSLTIACSDQLIKLWESIRDAALVEPITASAE